MNHPAANKTSIASANPTHIEVRGARVHNLRNANVDIPLGQLVGVCGVSGSGKSSLALGVLYAEGSRRYLEALSTYTRRRMGQAARADVDEVRYVPAALALHQRPSVPGVRSTFGTMSELLNSLRLLFSRVGSHPCPHCGAYVPPSMSVAAEQPITCATCGKTFFGPGAEELAFNSGGACPTCGGTGTVRRVNEAALVPDESKTINEGAVLPWGSLMWDLMKQVCGEMGVRLDVPFRDLTPEERDIVFHGPAEKRHILYKAKKGNNFAELDFTYYNAVYTVENALAKAKDEKGLARVARFLTEGPCPDCEGTRLSAAARGPLVRGINLAKACEMTLDEAVNWVDGVPESLAEDLRPMAISICESFQHTARRLLELGLGYLSLDRAGSTLSTGERQRVQLARAVRNRTTGVLYVLDEPSIGLHPANIDGLLGVMRDLLADGNSVVMVDHDTRILAAADYLVEMGPEAGAGGGHVVACGTPAELRADDRSLIGRYLPTAGEAGNAATELAYAREIDAHSQAETRAAASAGETTPACCADAGEPPVANTASTEESHGTSTEQPAKLDHAAGVAAAAPASTAAADPMANVRPRCPEDQLFEHGTIHLETSPLHTVHALSVDLPVNRLTTVTGVSGSGKTTLVLEELIPALNSINAGETLPASVRGVDPAGIVRAQLIDATPIGANVRSTVATYCGVLDDLRRAFARTEEAKAAGLKAGAFSYNTGKLRCPTCDGTGQVSLDVQFLPDVDVPCPDCRGRRYSGEADAVTWNGHTLAQLMAMSIDEALEACASLKKAHAMLQTLHDLGLGYLTLGEATPALSGGEAQRLKLASEMGKAQHGALFVFDEPTIGLHPRDVRTLLNVFQHLVEQGATVVVIEHDLDFIRNADYVVDMGPGGGQAGGRVVACGTPEQIAANPDSVTGRYLRSHLFASKGNPTFYHEV
ncbi:ATP-binding cassette domain-containing protein [Senegalimassilia anaerobia]|uniref:ATP-binding cassette domain-containing protein n=1 Tax=Senegalimassilia anaerobia TaxID=1473216 RepID=UPI0026F36116|nr:ATP-binding cassette domain-containing protein [Senegalimassilia anaerobia]